MGIIVIVVIILAGLAAFLTLRGGKKETIKIGAIISLSGPGSNLLDVRDGMILATDEVNSRGGVNGRAIELIIEDNKSNPSEGEKAFNRIEEIHHPLLYVSTLSSVSLALSSIAEQKEVVLVGLVVGNPNLIKEKNGFSDITHQR